MDAQRILDILSTVLFSLAGVSILFCIIRYIRLEYRGHKNRTAPVYTGHATVYCKHEETDAPYLGLGYSYVYYVTFHTDLGESLKLYMTRDDFYPLQEGTAGELTWQGEKFWKFIPDQK